MYEIAFLLIRNWYSKDRNDSPLVRYLKARQHISSGFIHSLVFVSCFCSNGESSSKWRTSILTYPLKPSECSAFSSLNNDGRLHRFFYEEAMALSRSIFLRFYKLVLLLHHRQEEVQLQRLYPMQPPFCCVKFFVSMKFVAWIKNPWDTAKHSHAIETIFFCCFNRTKNVSVSPKLNEWILLLWY